MLFEETRSSERCSSLRSENYASTLIAFAAILLGVSNIWASELSPDVIETDDGLIAAYVAPSQTLVVRAFNDSSIDTLPVSSFSSPKLWSRESGEIVVFFKDSSCGVSSTTRSVSGDWSREERLSIQTKFGVEVHQHHRLGNSLFVVNADGELERWIDNQGNFSLRSNLGGNLTSSVSAVTTKNGSIMVFGRGADGQMVAKTWRDPTQTVCDQLPCSAWSGWSAMGGQIVGVLICTEI